MGEELLRALEERSRTPAVALADKLAALAKSLNNERPAHRRALCLGENKEEEEKKKKRKATRALQQRQHRAAVAGQLVAVFIERLGMKLLKSGWKKRRRAVANLDDLRGALGGDTTALDEFLALHCTPATWRRRTFAT